MSIVIQFDEDEELKALPILLRHSPGSVLPERTYVVEISAAQVLREAGIAFREVSPPFEVPMLQDGPVGERI